MAAKSPDGKGRRRRTCSVQPGPEGTPQKQPNAGSGPSLYEIVVSPGKTLCSLNPFAPGGAFAYFRQVLYIIQHMKKALFYPFLLLSLFVFSCNKQANDVQTAHAPRAVKTAPATLNKEGDLSEGDIHNIIVQAYIDEYGLSEFTVMNRTNATTVVSRQVDIAADKGYLGTLSAEDVKRTIDDGFINDDFFDVTTDELKPMNDICQVSLAGMNNQDIVTALNDIKTLADNNDANFLADANDILANLKDLTVGESAMISGYQSTLNASYQLWDRNLPEQAQNRQSQLMSLASADARGFHYGFWKTFAALGAAADDHIDVCNMMGRIFAANFSNAYSGGAGVH